VLIPGRHAWPAAGLRVLYSHNHANADFAWNRPKLTKGRCTPLKSETNSSACGTKRTGIFGSALLWQTSRLAKTPINAASCSKASVSEGWHLCSYRLWGGACMRARISRRELMTKDQFKILKAVPCRKRAAVRKEGRMLAALCMTNLPQRFRISVKPERNRAALRVRCGVAPNQRNHAYVQ
jgi:hypothetical protein